MPRVSAILPTYNRAHILGNAIDSVLAQTYKDFELIIIDDGSVDNTAALIGQYRDSRLRYVRLEENGGLAHARNCGVENAKANLLAWIDSDDEWLPEKLQKQVDYFDRSGSGDLGLVFSAKEVINEHGTQIAVDELPFAPDFLSSAPLEDVTKRLFVGNFITPVTVMIRKECFDTLGRFSEDISGSDDYEFWLRVAGHYRIGYIPEVLAKYRTYESNMSNKMTRSGEAFYHRMKIVEMAVERYPYLGDIGRERLASWSRAYAHQSLMNGDYQNARSGFSTAIMNAPLHLPTYVSYALSAIGTPGQQVYVGLRRIGRRG